jgi:hypothetical protein
MTNPYEPAHGRPDPSLRAADTDREAAAAALGRHLSDGRLTVEEYEERLARAYAARTYGELDALFADLPRGSTRPAAAPGPVRTGGCTAGRRPVRSAWAGWLTVALVVTSIWLVSSLMHGVHAFWPFWVIVPWGAVLLARTLSGGPHPAGSRRRRW